MIEPITPEQLEQFGKGQVFAVELLTQLISKQNELIEEVNNLRELVTPSVN